MKYEYAYQFVGGPWNGTILNRDQAEFFCDGHSEDLSEIRNAGGCVHRHELDNQPTFDGYLGPMGDGTRTVNGIEIAVLRYETQEVYDMLSR